MSSGERRQKSVCVVTQPSGTMAAMSVVRLVALATSRKARRARRERARGGRAAVPPRPPGCAAWRAAVSTANGVHVLPLDDGQPAPAGREVFADRRWRSIRARSARASRPRSRAAAWPRVAFSRMARSSGDRRSGMASPGPDSCSSSAGVSENQPSASGCRRRLAQRVERRRILQAEAAAHARRLAAPRRPSAARNARFGESGRRPSGCRTRRSIPRGDWRSSRWRNAAHP